MKTKATPRQKAQAIRRASRARDAIESLRDSGFTNNTTKALQYINLIIREIEAVEGKCSK